MALDEDSLEAMLRRQRSAEDEHQPTDARLIEGNDEFEVYERAPAQQELPQDPPAPEAPAPQTAPPAPEAPAPQTAPPAPQAAPPAPVAPPPATVAPALQAAPPAPVAPAPVAPPPEPVAQAPTYQSSEPLYEQPAPEAPATPEPVPAPEPVAPAPVPDPVPAAPEPAAPPAKVMSRPRNECRVAIVQSDYHRQITDQMSSWAKGETEQLGGKVSHHLHVPGAYDLPLVCKQLLAQDDVDAVVAIGCIIQGETGHDEVIAYATAQNLQALAMDTGKPVGFAVSGPRMNAEQAEARIVMGRNAARSVMQQWRALRTLA